jgi:hypothetical protein
MEGDIYLKGDRTESGVHEAAVDKMENETPDFVVFNGSAGSLSKERALKAKVGETVRIFSGMPDPISCRAFTSSARFLTRSIRKGRPRPSAMCSPPWSPPAERRSSNSRRRFRGIIFSSITAWAGCRRARPDFSMWKDRPTQKYFRASNKAAKTAAVIDGGASAQDGRPPPPRQFLAGPGNKACPSQSSSNQRGKRVTTLAPREPP